MLHYSKADTNMRYPLPLFFHLYPADRLKDTAHIQTAIAPLPVGICGIRIPVSSPYQITLKHPALNKLAIPFHHSPLQKLCRRARSDCRRQTASRSASSRCGNPYTRRRKIRSDYTRPAVSPPRFDIKAVIAGIIGGYTDYIRSHSRFCQRSVWIGR